MPRTTRKAAHMPSFTLQDIFDAADQKYGPTVIELPDGNVTLDNILGIKDKTKRKKLGELLKNLEDLGDDLEAAPDRLSEIVRQVVASKPDADRLLKAFAGHTARLLELVNTWAAASQPGEASTSSS